MKSSIDCWLNSIPRIVSLNISAYIKEGSSWLRFAFEILSKFATKLMGKRFWSHRLIACWRVWHIETISLYTPLTLIQFLLHSWCCDFLRRKIQTVSSWGMSWISGIICSPSISLTMRKKSCRQLQSLSQCILVLFIWLIDVRIYLDQPKILHNALSDIVSIWKCHDNCSVVWWCENTLLRLVITLPLSISDCFSI